MPNEQYEQATGNKYIETDHRMDIGALGLTLYHALTDYSDISDLDTEKVMKTKGELPAGLKRDVVFSKHSTSPLRRLFQKFYPTFIKLTHPDPNKRFPTALHAVKGLDEILYFIDHQDNEGTSRMPCLQRRVTLHPRNIIDLAKNSVYETWKRECKSLYPSMLLLESGIYDQLIGTRVASSEVGGDHCSSGYLKKTRRVTIGRAKDSDIILSGPGILTVSRKHAGISYLGGEYILHEWGSHNGTAVNGKLLKERQSIALQTGDKLKFGDCERVFVTFDEDLYFSIKAGKTSGQSTVRALIKRTISS